MQNLRYDWGSLAQRLHGRVWRLRSDVKVALARRTGAAIGADCILDPGAEAWHGLMLARRGRISMGAHCQLGRGALLHPWGGSIRLGCNVFLGPYVVVYGHGGVEIGDQALISMHCRILSSNHAIPPPGIDIRTRPDEMLPTKIGRDVWLGAGVTVLGGVEIGDGCVVGAGAVVTRDLPSHTISWGNPAQVVRERI